jgi:hypothetical protein
MNKESENTAENLVCIEDEDIFLRLGPIQAGLGRLGWSDSWPDKGFTWILKSNPFLSISLLPGPQPGGFLDIRSILSRWFLPEEA